jgi:hypothetical protein
MRVHTLALGLTLGIVWGGAAFVMTLLYLATGWFEPWVKLMSSAYMGQAPTLLGSLAALVGGFIDGLLFGLVGAALYNGLSRRLGPRQEPPAEQ